MQPDAKAQDWTEGYIDIYTDMDFMNEQAMDPLPTSPKIDVLHCTVCTGMDRLRTGMRRRRL